MVVAGRKGRRQKAAARQRHKKCRCVQEGVVQVAVAGREGKVGGDRRAELLPGVPVLCMVRSQTQPVQTRLPEIA